MSRRGTPEVSFVRRRAFAFTVIELLVSMGILIVAIFALATVFDMSSETTGRTVAHAEILEASAAVQQRVTDQVSKIEPGLLIIESPAPTLARSEIQGGERLFRLRHDRLVFVAMGAPGEFQSFTDPVRGTPTDPTQEPASSREALIYLGPGIPLSDATPPQELDFLAPTVGLTAVEWVFAHRAILLLTDDPLHAGWFPPDMNVIAGAGGLLKGGSLASIAPDIRQGRMDAVISNTLYRASGATIIDIINSLTPAALLVAAPPIAGLWDANLTPTTASLGNTADPDYYTRSGSTLQPRLADFRIEWTDMRDNLGVPDYGTRWFGLRPYWASPVTDVDAVQFKAQCRRDFTSVSIPSPEEDERLVFESKIEWSNPTNGAANAQAAYRAIWRADTWQYRPKALRFTYRIYDAQNRLKQRTEIDLNEDGIADASDVVRWGQEFSIVVPIP
jgi:hypothetical protein